jgi:hypothetical protein
MRGGSREILGSLRSQKPLTTGGTGEHGVERRSGCPGFRDIRFVLQSHSLVLRYFRSEKLNRSIMSPRAGLFNGT